MASANKIVDTSNYINRPNGPLSRFGKSLVGKVFSTDQPVQIFQQSVNAIPSNFLSGDYQLDFQIPGFNFHIKNILLEVTLSETSGSNSIQPTNPFFWLRRIEIYSGTGSKLIQTLRDFSMYKRFYSGLSIQNQKKESHNMYLDPTDITQPQNIPAGTTNRIYYIPLPGNMFESSPLEINLSAFPNNYFLFRLYSRNIVESGSGTLSCVNVRIIFNCIDSMMQTKQKYKALQDNLNFNIIDDIAQTEQTLTLGASTRNVIKLTGHTGLMSEIAVIARANADLITNGAIRQFINLGNSGQFEILDSSQANIIGGQPITLTYMRNYYGKEYYLGRLFTENYIYPYPFGEPTSAYKRGVSEINFMHFKDGQDYIALTPGALGTAAVYTVTPSGTAASGSFRFFWKNKNTEEISVSDTIAYNATAATLASTLMGLNTWPYNLTATFSGPLTATATLTLSGKAATELYTLDHFNVINEDAETSGSAVVSFAVTLTTQPVEGASASVSSAATVLVTGQKHRVVSCRPGMIDVQDL